MYRSIGYPVPEHEGNESEERGSDEPIDVDTVDVEENHAPQPTKKLKPRLEKCSFNVILPRKFHLF